MKKIGKTHPLSKKLQAAILDTVTLITERPYLDGDIVCYEGPKHFSWHHLLDGLNDAQCVAAIHCARYSDLANARPSMLQYLARLETAKNACASDGGRRPIGESLATLYTSNSGADQYAWGALCAIVTRADTLAHQRRQTRLGFLRLHLAQKSLGQRGGPYDTYIRLAAGMLGGY